MIKLDCLFSFLDIVIIKEGRSREIYLCSVFLPCAAGQRGVIIS